MPKATHIQSFGNQLKVLYDDGSSALAYATPGELWIVGQSSGGGGGITIPDSLVVKRKDGQEYTLNRTQLTHAATIIETGRAIPGVGVDGIIIALMTALVESTLRNLANPTYPESQTLPNDGLGYDHDSLGLFQQRPASGWGSVAELMNPVYETRAFLGGSTGPNSGNPPGLLDIPGWQSMSKGEAAQAVQVSAFPDAYDNFEPAAWTIYNALTSSGGGTNSGFRWPAPTSSLNINNGYPEDGFRTPGRPNHEGIDFGIGLPPGCHNRAMAAGRVIENSWYYGYGLTVILDHGTHDGKNYKSLYGHIAEGGVKVSMGADVISGADLGVVGNTGNSFGRHVHWEVWENGNKIDPVLFMKRVNPSNEFWPWR